MSTNETKCAVAVIGVGLVGSAFIDQLLAFPSKWFKLISLSSSKANVFSPDGLSFTSSWQSELSKSQSPLELASLLKNLEETTESNPNLKIVIVDNTSSDTVAYFYPQFLRAGFHVITPNKKAFSSELALYEDILNSSLHGSAKFLNESTVGAGLPVISTLKDLVATGDKVYKIEGVFSGTMSYIFNEFSTPSSGTSPSFSSVVRVAREKGYTEPHPADDLNGADVARKLTILSRYIPSLAQSLPLGYRSVTTTSLIPPELEGIPTGDEFLQKLPQFDDRFEKMRDEAKGEAAVLRFVGVIDVKEGLIRAALEKYPETHPFATSLGGSDNIIMFHTKRYGARPLIIQGAGAGAAVTAMGVMSDLLKLT